MCITDTECQTDVVRMRRVRVFAFWTQCVSPEAECQGKCLPDDACHGICLPDEECQGIGLLDVVRVLQIPSVKADVVRTRSVRAFAF